MIALTNDVKILSNLNSKGHELPIYSEYHNSRFLGSMPPQLRLLVEHRKLLNFSHMHGLSLAKYTRSPKLKEKLRLVSIAQDKDAKWFCAAL